MVGGIILCFRANTLLIRPAIPAVPIVCPILDLIDPIPQNCFNPVYFSNATFIAEISVGSPIFVAVPCASI